jgi:hypothetical protein
MKEKYLWPMARTLLRVFDIDDEPMGARSTNGDLPFSPSAFKALR